jgi:hypothetical protein
MIKRMADFLEKMAVGSFLIGLFQGQNMAVILGLLSLAGSFTLTRLENRKANP